VILPTSFLPTFSQLQAPKSIQLEDLKYKSTLKNLICSQVSLAMHSFIKNYSLHQNICKGTYTRGKYPIQLVSEMKNPRPAVPEFLAHITLLSLEAGINERDL